MCVQNTSEVCIHRHHPQTRMAFSPSFSLTRQVAIYISLNIYELYTIHYHLLVDLLNPHEEQSAKRPQINEGIWIHTNSTLSSFKTFIIKKFTQKFHFLQKCHNLLNHSETKITGFNHITDSQFSKHNRFSFQQFLLVRISYTTTKKLKQQDPNTVLRIISSQK